MTCKFENETFFIAGKEFFFGTNAVVNQALHIKDRWIVRCEIDNKFISQNVFCFSNTGELLWIIEPSRTESWGDTHWVWKFDSIQWAEMWKAIVYSDSHIWWMVDLETGARIKGPDFLRTRRNLLVYEKHPFMDDGFDVNFEAITNTGSNNLVLLFNKTRLSIGENLYVNASFAYQDRIFILLSVVPGKESSTPLQNNLWCFDKSGRKLWELDSSKYAPKGNFFRLYWSLQENKPILEKNEKLYAVDPNTGVVTGEFQVSED